MPCTIYTDRECEEANQNVVVQGMRRCSKSQPGLGREAESNRCPVVGLDEWSHHCLSRRVIDSMTTVRAEARSTRKDPRKASQSLVSRQIETLQDQLATLLSMVIAGAGIVRPSPSGAAAISRLA